MRVLLDTHALLWIVADSPRLSNEVRHLAGDRTTTKLVSTASLWEMAIKVRLGKLDLRMEFEAFVNLIGTQGLAEFLPVTVAHVKRLRHLELHHRDPFDRLLVAQALTEGVPLVSADASLDAYGVNRVW
jgi:PIN domain nuclease of toxin-antitoxin system